jgi:hypothetical protein
MPKSKQQDDIKSRVARYRELAGEALRTAADCKSPDARTAYINLMEGWNDLAAETEFLNR